MGLIREIQLINRAIDENNKLLNEKERETIKTNKLINDIRNECRAVIFELLQDEKEAKIITNIDENVGKIAKYITNKKELKTVEIIEGDEWKRAKKELHAYNITDVYELENIIEEIFLQEYKKTLRIKKLKNDVIKEELKEKLKNAFINYLKLDSNKGAIIKQLERQEIKSDIINELAENKQEKEIINQLYYKILNDIKKGYRYEIEEQKQLEKLNKIRRQKKPVGGFILLGLCSLLNIGKKRR